MANGDGDRDIGFGEDDHGRRAWWRKKASRWMRSLGTKAARRREHDAHEGRPTCSAGSHDRPGRQGGGGASPRCSRGVDALRQQRS